MRTITKCLAIGAVALGWASGVGAQPNADENAALRYWRAFSLMSESDAEMISTLTDAKAEGDAWLDDEANTSWLDEQGDTIELLLDASEMPEADFGIDYDKGIEALLTHLAPMRQAARLTLLRAEADLASGDTRSAIEHAAGAMRMAQHLTDDRVIISSLVAASIFDSASDFIENALNEGEFAKADLAPIRAALDRFDTGDPFGAERGIATEGEIFAKWTRRRLASLPPDERRELILSFLGHTEDEVGPEGEAVLDILSRDEGLNEQMRLYTMFFRQAREAWDKEDARERLRLLEKGVKEGVFGHVAVYLAPSLTRVQEQDSNMRERFEHIERLIEAR